MFILKYQRSTQDLRRSNPSCSKCVGTYAEKPTDRNLRTRAPSAAAVQARIVPQYKARD
jgi:hypothetical protein